MYRIFCSLSLLLTLVFSLTNFAFALTELKDEKALHWLRDSAEYQALTRQIYQDAGTKLATRLHSLHKNGALKGKQWGISMDADETILDNSLYTLERARQGLGYTPDSWARWVAREEAGIVPGVKGFMQYVKSMGGKIAIVTNRNESVKNHTKNNLDKLKLPYDCLLSKTDTSEKEARWKIIENGKSACGDNVKLIAWLGDNIGDFPNLTQAIRNADDSAFADFGSRYFVIPNPSYGSWEKNPWR